MSDLFSATYNPDVLSCLANLSNDEVFTPPEVVNQMLDMLPKEIWSDKNATFLDPACKSGVFLREIAKRLIDAQLPNYEQISYEINEKLRAGGELDGRDIAFQNMLEDVIEHVFKNQVFGIAITELTSLLSRRSVYCSKYPQSEYSVVRFDNPEGRIDYKQMQHTWRNGKCVYCGASEGEYDREEGKEQYAYEFIHLDNPEEVFDMKFDVIIGNPPYQLNDGGGNGSSASPIYQHFIEQALKLNPRYLCMIVPAKWHTGGKGLDSFRENMLNDGHIKKMVTYRDSRDCFQGVDVAGGITYFLRSRDESGNCEATYRESGSETKSLRQLNEFPIYIASDKAAGIIRKVQQKRKGNYSNIVRSRKPFGISAGKKSDTGELMLRYKDGLTRVSKTDVTAGNEMIYKWKVIISKASAEHAGQADRNGQFKMLARIEVLEPATVCSETYLVVDALGSKEEAEALAQYLRTKFARFLIWQATPTQNISKGCFVFLPEEDLSTEICDSKLYQEYDLSEDEINYIESLMRTISDGD